MEDAGLKNDGAGKAAVSAIFERILVETCGPSPDAADVKMHEWLSYFDAVAEEPHFGRAAATVHIAQPPLSNHVQVLQREPAQATGVTVTSRELTFMCDHILQRRCAHRP